MLKIPFTILGKPWTIRLLKKKKYHKTHGQDSFAITHCDKRCMDLGPEGRSLEIIIHELVHAYVWELCTGMSDLNVEALEEHFCELMAKRGRELLDLADSLDAQVKAASKETV